ERHIAEMRAERDQAFELVEQMKEHVSDVDALIDSLIEAFEMQLSEDGKRTRDALPESIKKILADAVALQKQAKGLRKKGNVPGPASQKRGGGNCKHRKEGVGTFCVARRPVAAALLARDPAAVIP